MSSRITLMIGLILTLLTFTSPSFAQSQVDKKVTTVYPNIHSKAPKLNSKVLKLALHAYYVAAKDGKVSNPILSIIDYSKPSTVKRLWIIDMHKQRVPFHTYVAHARNSGLNKATHFSNRFGSKESSLGVYRTGNTYISHVGYALRLIGLEKGVNDHALRRGIVMHGAWYVSQQFADKYHRLGRSWGCPAVNKQLAKPIINKIKNGSIIVAYYPDHHWLSHSHYLQA